jgi:hypothetical protein
MSVYQSNCQIIENGGRAQGSLQCRGDVWSVRLRDVKGRHRRIRLGTLAELPTENAARVAARSVVALGAERIGHLIDTRYRKRNSTATYTQQWYREKLIEQGYKCAICQDTPKRLVVDHDHGDGQLRGLLCSTCNSGIGMLRDDVAILRAALSYLEAYDQLPIPQLSEKVTPRA